MSDLMRRADTAAAWCCRTIADLSIGPSIADRSANTADFNTSERIRFGPRIWTATAAFAIGHEELTKAELAICSILAVIAMSDVTISARLSASHVGALTSSTRREYEVV